MSLAAAAGPGLPFVEDFSDTTLKDEGATTADWSLALQRLQFPSPARRYGGFITGTTVTGSDVQAADTGDSRVAITADFDGDGRPDLAVGRKSAQRNRLYLNNGTATPYGGVTGTDITTDSHDTFELIAADVDRDGNIDLIAGNHLAPNILYLNNGAGPGNDPFQGVSGIPLGADAHSTRSLVLADLDGDGNLDLAEGNKSEENYYYLGNPAAPGTNPFNGVSGILLTADNNATEELAAGDFNGDGTVDLFAANEINGSGEVNRLYLNDGIGDPFDSLGAGIAVQPGDVHESRDVVSGDVDGDGDLDLVVGNKVEEDRLYLNDGSGGFAISSLLPGGVTATRAVRLADVDGDGDLDLFRGSKLEVNQVIFNNGTADPFAGAEVVNLSPDADDTENLALADFDGDGDLDLISVNVNQPTVLYLNQGSPNPYQDTVGSDISTDANVSFGVEAADMDGDGDLDLVVADFGGPGRLYLNNGTSDPFAGVSGADIGPGADSSRPIAVGDVNRDGHLDIVEGNFSEPNHLYLNNGTAAPFAAVSPVILPGGSLDTRSLGLADLNGDGWLDVVVGNSLQQDQVLLNDGTGGFPAASGLGVVTLDTWGIAIGDVNRDGGPDIVTGLLSAPNRIFLNNGTADPFNGVAGTNLDTDGDDTRAVVLADMDRDGDLDLLTGNENQVNRIYVNSGGMFPAGGTPVSPATNATWDIDVSDQDGDGDLDLLAANSDQVSIVHLNNGTPDPFSDGNAVPITTDAGRARGIVGADFDGDGDADVAVTRALSMRNRLYFNNGSRASPVPVYALTASDAGTETNDTAGITLADADGDGDLDILTAEDAGPILLYRNDGLGQFTVESISGALRAYEDVAAVDLDHDGDLDLVFAIDSGRERILFNSGAGWTGSNLGAAIRQSLAIAVGDLNRDGHPDVVAGNEGEANRFYLNDGNGNFSVEGDIFADLDETLDIALGDLDGDGHLDVVTANNARNRLYLNDGTGAFTNRQNISADDQTSEAIALGDMDRDGDLDVVVGNDGFNRLYLNTGGGTFAAGTNIGTLSNSTQAIVLSDWDRDGDLDVIAANDSNTVNMLYLNNGTAAPFAAVTGLVLHADAFSTLDIAAGDVNGDGLPDLVTAEELSRNRVYRRAVFDTARGRAESIRVDTEVSAITNITLTATGTVPPHTGIQYFLSNNGGVQYFEVQPGSAFTFPTAGTNLRWRVRLDSRSPVRTAALDTVSLTSGGATSVTLTVVSAFGSPTPPVGANSYALGTTTNAMVSGSPVGVGPGVRQVSAGWTGTGDVPASGSSTNTGSFTLNQNSSVTWQWQPQYWLDTGTTSSGTVDVADGWFDGGSNVTVTATPAIGHQFLSWSGDATGTNPVLNLTMDAPKAVTANFAAASFTITPGAGPNGSISPAAPVVVPYGGSTNFVITPNTNYHVADVLVDLVSVGPVTNYTFINVTNDRTIDATFAIDEYDLTVVSPYGTPTPTNGITAFAYNSNVTASVAGSPVTNLGSRYTLSGWTGTGSVPASGVGSSVSFNITNESSITWEWDVEHFLDLSVSGPGSVDTASQYVPEGTAVVVTATSTPGFVFLRWTGDVTPGQELSNPLTVPMDTPRTLVAQFGIAELSVAKSADDSDYVLPGQVVTYALALNSSSNQPYQNILVTDPIPSGTTYQAGSVTGGGVFTNGMLQWGPFDLQGPVDGVSSGGLCPTFVELPSNKDTTLSEADPDDNYGNFLDMATRDVPGSDMVSLMRFNVSGIPTNAVLHSARLRISSVMPDPDQFIRAHRLLRNFNEAETTWNDRNDENTWTAGSFGPADYDPVGYGPISPVGFAPSSGTGNLVDLGGAMQWIDIMPMVQDWLDGTPNRGIALVSTGTSTNLVTFHARDSNLTVHHPVLEITYLLPSVGPCTGSLEIVAEADTFVDEAAPAFPQGASDDIYTQLSPGLNANMLLRFGLDRIPTNVTIDTATLTTETKLGLGTHNIDLHRMVTDWRGRDATWLTTDGTNAWSGGAFSAMDHDPSVESTFNASGILADQAADLTALVGQWVNLAVPNYGVALIPTTSGAAVTHQSREENSLDKMPRLSIDWSVPGGGAGTSIHLDVDRTVASGISTVTVTMLVKASPAVNDVVPDAVLTLLGGTGVTANLLSGPPATPTLVDGNGVAFTYLYEIVPGTNLTTLGFQGAATGSATFNPGLSGEVLVVDQLSYQVQVDDPFPVGQSAITNIATLTSTSLAAPFSSSVANPVPAADLVLDKSVSAPTVAASTPFMYTLTVSNQGPNAVASLEVTDPLPPGILLNGAAPSSGTYTAETWTVTNLAAGATATLDLTVEATPAIGATSVTNTAFISSSSVAGENLLNNTNQAVVAILPDVAVAPITGAAEPSTSGSFSISRSGSTSGALVVDFALTGSASESTDYAFVGTSTTIPAGQASTTVTISPIDDLDLEGTETVDLDLVPSSAYTITATNASLNLADDERALTVASPHGIPSPGTGANTVSLGDSITASIGGSPQPDGVGTQQVTVGWIGTGDVIPGSGSSTSFTVTQDSSITWQWQTQYFLDTATNGNGAVDVADGWFDAGTNVTLTATPATGYDFTGWTGDAAGTNPVLVLTMDAAKTVTANFAIQTFTITPSAGANGSISPSAPVVVNYGGSTNFVITPAANYHVADVLVDAVSVGAVTNYTFTNVTNDRTISASFAIDQHDLVVSSPYGTPTPAAGTNTYDYNTLINASITGSPAVFGTTRYVATGWTGTGDLIAGSGSSTSFNLTQNSTLNWQWQTQYFLDTATNGNGAVDVADGWFDAGTNITITATPAVGYDFVGWSGDATGTNPVLNLTMDAAKTVTANFAIQTFTITPSAGANGSISPSAPVVVNYGGSTNFVITPAANYHVADVLVDAVSVGAVTNYTFTNVTNDRTIDATFAIDRHDLVVTSPYGTPTPAAGTNNYDYNTLVNASIAGSPAVFGTTQYVATGWTGTGDVIAGSGTATSFNLTQNSTLNWQWQTQYFLDTATNGNGSVDVADGWFDAGTNITITATPAVGYDFVGWTGDATGTNPVLNLTIDAAKSVAANFAIQTFTITPSAGANGSISPSAPVVVNYGGSTNFVITPAANHHVADILVDAVSVGAVTNYTFTNVTNDRTISASFAIDRHDLVVTSPYGTPTPAAGTNTYDYNTLVNASIAGSPAVFGTTQYVATGWTGTGDVTAGSGAATSFNVTQNSSITWTWQTQYRLTTADDGNGTLDVASGWYNDGAPVSLTATPTAGYEFDRWTGDLPLADQQLNPVSIVMDQARNLTATFRLITYTISTTATGNGTVTPQNPTIQHGNSANLSIQADAHHHIADVLVDGASIGTFGQGSNTYSLVLSNVTADRTVEARFAIDTYDLTLSLTPAGAVTGGARWRLTAGPDVSWQNSGDTIPQVPHGAYTVLYEPVFGFLQPTQTAVNVTGPAAASITAAYRLPEWVALPGGTFEMGIDGGTNGHTTTVSPFRMSPGEVTIGQYQEYLTATGGTLPSQPWNAPDLPVLNVAWDDAVGFLNWRSIRDGRTPAYTLSNGVWTVDRSVDGYRLPTEAEWEYAARGGLPDARYPWGATISAADANYGVQVMQTTPAGTYPPNAFGLFDMGGNVWEWVNDWYSSTLSDNATDPLGPATGSQRVIRGGSWVTVENNLRNATRNSTVPTSTFSDLGFRMVCTVTSTDQDGDGLPDDWEQEYFGDPTSADPTADSDGDGASNRDEYLAGTDPRDALSYLRISAVFPAAGGTGIVVEWPSEAGKLYRVETSSDLTAGYSLLAGDVEATPPVNTIIDLQTTIPQCYYRVRAQGTASQH